MANKLIPLGTKIRRGGDEWTVGAVHSQGGPLRERYYALTLPYGSVSMVPASILEPEYESQHAKGDQ